MHRIKSGASLLLALCLAIGLPAGAQVFVVPGGAGSEDGSSWDNAYGDVATALNDEQAADDDVWVAGGVYELNNVIVWPSDVAGYGGFAGNESSLDARDVNANETILDAGDESRVIRAIDGSNRRIDGFTITGGTNVGAVPGPGDWGGAVHIWNGDDSNVMSNCIIRENGPGQGAGMLLHAASWVIEDTIFQDNATNVMGGAIYINNSAASPTINNCMFIGNSSGFGAVTIRVGASATITNSVFINNQSSRDGNAIRTRGSGSTGTIAYCTFYNNGSEGDPSPLFAFDSADDSLDVSNSIIWGNHDNAIGGQTDINNSIVQGGIGGGIDEDPLFVDAENGDLQLQANSPAIDIGTDWPATDILGVERPHGEAADLGAYEYSPEPLNVSISGPDSATVGDAIEFTATHNAVGDAVIEWHKDGQLIDGANSATLNLSEVSTADSGMYTVFVNADNGEESASITLEVVSGLPVASSMALLLLSMCIALAGMLMLRHVRN